MMCGPRREKSDWGRVKRGAVTIAVAVLGFTAAAQASELGNFKLLKLRGTGGGWDGGKLARAPWVWCAIVRDTHEVLGARNCRALAPLDRLAETSQLSDE